MPEAVKKLAMEHISAGIACLYKVRTDYKLEVFKIESWVYPTVNCSFQLVYNIWFIKRYPHLVFLSP